MKLLLGVLLIAMTLHATPQQSLSLVSVAPVQCIVGQYCGYPHTLINQTGIAIIRMGPPSITDSRGNHWTRDFCMTYTADCFYHAYFTETTNPGDQIFYTPYNGGASAVLLMYPGKYDFVGGNVGDYASQNSAFPDCVNNANCPYSWTLPVDTEPGDSEICFAEQNAVGHGIPRPGWGFQVEFNNQLPDQAAVAVLDKISPGGVEFCSLEWAGPSHWLAGLAVYRKN